VVTSSTWGATASHLSKYGADSLVSQRGTIPDHIADAMLCEHPFFASAPVAMDLEFGLNHFARSGPRWWNGARSSWLVSPVLQQRPGVAWWIEWLPSALNCADGPSSFSLVYPRCSEMGIEVHASADFGWHEMNNVYTPVANILARGPCGTTECKCALQIPHLPQRYITK